MKYALLNGEKCEATKGGKGLCPSCGSEMLPKCGNIKVYHWAHKGSCNCDPWWENETEWHREWKNHFPVEWQEILQINDASGEKHIADIRTDTRLVIEFQHSAIKSDEIRNREDFYKNMVWVVDGMRVPGGYKRFCKGASEFMPGLVANGVDTSLRDKVVNCSIWRHLFSTYFPESCFPKRWLMSSVPIYFDFQGTDSSNQHDENRSALWVLFPGNLGGWSIVAKLCRRKFVEYALTEPCLLLAQDICSLVAAQRAKENEQREFEEWRKRQQADAFQQFWVNPRRGRYRI